ncbi:MAG: undecaprenyldiphospho-muramoylpentapeptide beta-N-acetylglucosaminyltransferase [Thermaerobacter sp.]|nr:undecaprenyldiphospho-muramoylpentapeptide beta-N-acetylglucosaminyltransferase [Thermaerobacter sp.]
MKIRVIFSGGGTGGHVYPAISLAHEVLRRHPGAEVLFVGAKRGLENQIVPREGFRLMTLETTSLPRRLSLEQLRTVYRALRGVVQARRILRDFSPDLVVGTGGYAAFPLLMAAALADYPTLIHEQNAYPSLTNRLLSRFVDKVAVSHREAGSFFPSHKVAVTGNPLRPEILSADRESARLRLNIAPEDKVLVAVGGSGGAKVLSETLSACYKEFALKKIRVFHVTGRRDYEAISRVAREYLGPYLTLIEYATNLPELLAAADLVISRPGGTTAELAYLGKPSILIPAPIAAENHQYHNAKVFSEAGAAILIPEHTLTPHLLSEKVSEVLFNEAVLSQMSRKAYGLSFPSATMTICDLLDGLIS